MDLHFTGIIIAVACFLVIGLFQVDVPRGRHCLYRWRAVRGGPCCVSCIGRYRRVGLVVYQGTVRATRAGGERMVPDEPETQRRI